MSEETPLLYFEDVLAETMTHRNDWLISVGVIAEFLDRDSSTVTTLITRKTLPARKVKIYGGREDGIWILRITDAEVYKTSHNKEAKTTNSANGNGNTNGHREAGVVILKEGSPILSHMDGENIMRALWDVKLAIQTLNKTMVETITALQDMTKALK